MAKGSTRLFFAFLHNNTDSRDDDVLKIAAGTKLQAVTIARNHCPYNFTLGKVVTRKQLRKMDDQWHALLWGQEPIVMGRVCFEDLDHEENQ